MKRVVAALAVVLLSACSSAPPPSAAPDSSPQTALAPARELTPWPDAVVYFAIVDRFANGSSANDANVDPSAKGTFHGGDLAGLTQQLDEIASLGATALWITPVVDNIDGFVTGAGFPDWGYHGYWADDFSTLDPRFGTESELKTLVDEAHRRGIRVLLDVVYNHAGYNSRYMRDPKTKGWLRSNENGTCGGDDITSCVAGLPDFRTEMPEVREASVRGAPRAGQARRPRRIPPRHRQARHARLLAGASPARRRGAGQRLFLLGDVWAEKRIGRPWFATRR